MSELGEGTAVSQFDELEDDHWVQVEYTYSNGLPVEGLYYATDGNGLDWVGRLNDKGQACLAGLPAGNVSLELLPAHEEETLKQLRQAIKKVLDEIIQAEKIEAAESGVQYAKFGPAGHQAAAAKGLWNGAVGLVSFAWDVVKTAAEIAAYLNPAERLGNMLDATYKSYRSGELTEAEWRESLINNYREEEFKDLAELLGFDLRTLTPQKIEEIKLLITEAYEVTAFILDDAGSQVLFTQFAKDYADVQSSYEWAEFAGGGIFEIVLAALLLAFTGGLGNVAQAASKIRHASKLKKLGTLFRRLGKLLKRKKLNRKVSVGIDSKKTVKGELPDKVKLKVKPVKRMKEKEVPCFNKNKKGDPAEYDRQLAGQQKGINEFSAQEYLDRRAVYNGKRMSTKTARDDFEAGLVKKYTKSGMTKIEAKKAALTKMKTLNALHNPDLYAGGVDNITDFGDAGVNKSIGSQWKSRVKELDNAAITAVKNGNGAHKMNVKLTRCK